MDVHKSVALAMDVHKSVALAMDVHKSVALAMDAQKSGFSCTENRSCVKVDADVLGSPSLTVRTVCVDVKQH